MGYRNWRQRWCKKEGNKVLGGVKRKGSVEAQISMEVNETIHTLNVGWEQSLFK